MKIPSSLKEIYPGYTEVQGRRSEKNGKVFTVIECNKKNLSLFHRALKFLSVVFLTTTSMFTALFSSRVRDCWYEVFSGKEIKHITLGADSEIEADDAIAVIARIFNKIIKKCNGSPLFKLPTLNTDESIFFSSPKEEEKGISFELNPNTTPSKTNFSSAENASLAFVLLNTDFLTLDLSEYPTTSEKALAFMSDLLKKNREKLPKEVQANITKLLQKFDCAYEVEVLCNALAKECNTVKEFNRAQHILRQTLMDRLLRGETLYLKSGWAGTPSGHNITLELTPYQRVEDGALMVKGRILNRGSGIDRHQVFAKGVKVAYDPELQLLEVPIEDFAQSTFLSHYFQLKFLVRPHNEDAQESEDTMRPTAFSEDDFYNVFLPSWPGGIQCSENSISTLAQRGPTCTVKPLITEMTNMLGEKYGKLAKFYITRTAWEAFMTAVGITEDNANQISVLLPKFSRRALKLKKAGLLSEKEMNSTNELCEKIKKSIFSIQRSKAEKLRSQTIDINSEVWEREHFSLQLPEIAPMPLAGKTNAPKKEVVFLNEMNENRIDQYVAEQLKLAVDIQKKGSLKKAKNIVLQTLRALPNPSNDRAWDQVKECKKLLKNISYMQQILLEALVHLDGKLVMTPQQACIWVKSLGIVYHFAKKTLPPELCQVYANGLKNLLTNRLPALFCPFSPEDLESFRDTVHLIYRDVSQSHQDAAVGEKVCIGEDATSAIYMEFVVSRLSQALEHPELAYLYQLSKSHKAWQQKLESKDHEELYKIQRAYDHFLGPDWDPIPYEYLALQRSFYLTALALDFRGKKKHRGKPELDFSGTLKNMDKLPAYFQVKFKAIEEQDKSDYNRGVFADAFPGIASQLGNEKQFDSETFATDFLGKKRIKDSVAFTSHSSLSLFQKTEVINIEKADPVAFNPLDMQDLLSIRTSKSLPLIQLEHYFSRNLPKLETPLFQSLFMACLFKVDENSFESPLKLALDRSPQSKEIENFFFFLIKSLSRAQAVRSWPIYFFLLRAYAISLSHCMHYQSNTEQIQKLIHLFEKEIDAVSSKSTLQKITGSACSAFDDHLLAMIPYLSNYDVLIPIIHKFNHIRAALHATESEASANENFYLQEDMQNGSLQVEGMAHCVHKGEKEERKMLPNQIVENDLYTALFTINYPAKEIFPGCYEFFDEKGIQYQIDSNSKDSLRIFRPFMEEDGQIAWYTFQTDDPFKNYGSDENFPCSNKGGYLQTSTISWFKVGKVKKALITSKKNGELICRVTEESIFHPKAMNLLLLKNYNHPIIHEISKITSPKQILAWKEADSGELSRIELKEFGIQFDRKISKDGDVRWKSSRDFGYYIDTHQKNSAFEPFPGYLVLANDKRDQKIICPSRRYAPDKIKFSGHQLPELNVDTINQLFTYNIDSDGKVIFTEESKALLYLIHLAIQKCDYSFGFQAIKKLMQHPIEWDISMVQMMRYFELPNPNEGDKLNLQPQASALRLKLKALMLSDSSKQMDQTENEFLKHDYINYLNQLNNIQGIERLSFEHERLLYAPLLSMPLSKVEAIILQNRMIFLKKQSFSFPQELAVQMISPMENHRSLPLSDQWNWIDASMQKKMISALEKPKPIAFTMRPGIAFLENLLFYYAVLQQEGPRDKIQEIENLLKDCRYEKDPRTRCVRSFLLSVLSNPRSYPPYKKLPELLDDQELQGSKRMTELEIIFRKLVQKKNPAEERSSFDNSIKNRKEVMIYPSKENLEATVSNKTTPVCPKFVDIPDLLLDFLIKEEVVTQSLPGNEELAQLEEKRNLLEELESFYTDQAKTDEPSIAREFGRLLKGILEVTAETKQQISMIKLMGDIDKSEAGCAIIDIKNDKIETAIAMLERLEDQEFLFLEKSKLEIEELLKIYSPELALEMHGALLSPLTFMEALVQFGRGEDDFFYQANPDLTEEELGEIKAKIGHYLLRKLNYQKRVRLLDDLRKVQSITESKGTNSIDYDVAKNRSIETLQSVRAYSVDESPHLLVFEAFADICLKEEQLKALNRLSLGDDSKDLIFEARTGFGKSKALIPLWLYLTGKKRKSENVPGIAMMTVPAPLYQQQVGYLKKVLGGAFNQSVFAFQFNRVQGNDLCYLQNLNQRLDRAAAEGMCVLTTVNSLHSLVNLKLKECLALEKTKENQAVIRELRALRYKVKHKLSNFFDESRECFDIRRYFDYAVGAPKSVQQTYCRAIGNLYATLLDLDLKIPFDFLTEERSRNNNPLTEERYDKEIKEILGRSLLEQLVKNKVIPDPGEQYDQLLLRHFLGDYDSNIDTYLDKISQSKKRLYAIYRDQLNVYLPRTLTRQCNGRYGLALAKTGNRFAYPFEKGIPKLSSQFSTIDDLLNFTIQGNLKTPLTLKDVSLFITSLKFRMEQAEDKQNFIEFDFEYQCYLHITQNIKGWPLSIFDCNQKNILNLLQVLNHTENIPLKLMFISDHILPQINLYTKKISSTAHNLVEAMENTYGASGTVNTETLSSKLSTIEHSAAPIGSILSMWKDSQTSIYTVGTEEAGQILRDAIMRHDDYRVIIDVNSTFRDLRDEREIAHIVFQSTANWDTPPVEAFSYYDETGQNLVFMRSKEGEELGAPILRDNCTEPLENIFIFMRESSTVGSDTPMPITAKALVTVGSGTERDAFLQGVGRMRGILKGQKVGFLIQDKDASTFREKSGTLTLSKILSVVSRNQGKRRGEDLFFNLRLLLQNLVEKQFWDYFDNDEEEIEKCMDLFHAMKTFFIEDSIQDPLESLKQSRGTLTIQDAIEQIKGVFFRKLSSILESHQEAEIINIAAIMKSFDELVELEKLPKTVQMGLTNESEGEVEIEAAEIETESTKVAEVEFDVGAAELEGEKDQQSEREQMTFGGLQNIIFTPAEPLPSERYFTLGIQQTSLASENFDKEFSPILENFYGSTNFFRINSLGGRPQGVLKTAYQYLLIREKGCFKVILMDQQDARAALEEMIKGNLISNTKAIYLMSSTGKVIAQDAQEEFDELQLNENPQLTFLIKIFSRNLNFSKKEIAYLVSLEPQKLKVYFDFLNKEIAYCWPPVSSILMDLQSIVERKRLFL